MGIQCKMKALRIILLAALLQLATLPLGAQMYTGVEGLLHVPSASMSEPGSLRVGLFVLDNEFTPTGYVEQTVPTYFISLTPYEWVEASFMGTAWKRDEIYLPDRTISVKVRPLKEGRWWPSIAFGTNDPIGTGFYRNYYVAAGKHFHVLGGLWGVDVAYRRYRLQTSRKWDGVVGGITYRPDFYPGLRLVAEWNGACVDMGLDVRLWQILRLQLTVQDFRYLSGGVCLEFLNL